MNIPRLFCPHNKDGGTAIQILWQAPQTICCRPKFAKHQNNLPCDFFYEKFIQAWFGDVPSYNYWFIMIMASGVCTGQMMRLWLCDPDVYGRRQEFKKPLPDRHRQWSYSLPYFNNRLRNMCTKYKWCLIDNEPDYSDIHPLKYRPDRKQIHRRCWMWMFSVPRYTIEDPLYTSVTHENMERIYQDCGYTKKPKGQLQED